ncbi:putative pentatricopeptide repeat-containing protein At1g17630 [Lycium barbarum]|uniref:putative pentatricopeptide repeat-containing protein At1g17630 n=1 Tax=Lycium barbarum TaxID=112863 RepID=UPI00293F2574|nr:putative pentatricopeptide repeat-containing protein At1g17630 [Lycium barbarum]XP_060218649.1 putative pentatricopeptide repeat-containing protein At1g17630 [Lycium barbarum]XP_060218657.1 putative pentatricopeptide repeat-containing protein At1g17630 [Lycium barbarum]XP_060218665.1 putative pentatricopeptide repeat-containing protein At1g17630 [Lycium barbarum]XP_060218673.1 putative pentatricopeptide repeat-containing protein At1g17630 [Lycium barbarum]XP_060218679.1 putative pentatricop
MLQSCLSNSRRFISVLPISISTTLSFPSKLIHFHSSHKTKNDLLDFFDHLLQQCNLNLQQLKQVHANIITTNSSNSSFIAARLISIYSKFGFVNEAQKVFKACPNECFSNLLLWNSILRANVSHGNCKETINLYIKMREFGNFGDGFGFPLIIRACGMFGDCNVCSIVHCHVIQMGFGNHLHVGNELMNMYGKIGRMDIARKVFDRMSVRTQISWNIIVSGFSQNFECDAAYETFLLMETEGFEPNSVTWTSLLSSFARCRRYEDSWKVYVLMRKKRVEATAEAIAVVISVCVGDDAIDKCEALHGYVIKGGFENNSIVINSLMCMYGKNGAVKQAECLFSGLQLKTIVSWNSLISCYAESGLCNEAYSLFLQLQELDDPTMKPNVISWSAVTGAFAMAERHEESLEIFRSMQVARVLANDVTISSVLSVCAELSNFHLGMEIHGYSIRFLMDRNTLVGNGLVNMYMKCGSLQKGNKVFKRIGKKDLISWNTMISGFGMHGLGVNALEIFDQMVSTGTKPDEVTFVAILSACSHAGLVDEGYKVFDQMKKVFGIQPQMEHYACMVDLLGRAGLLQRASEMVQNMPMKPNACVWGALLNSCRMHKNMEVAEGTAAQIFNLESEMTGSYMLLCNLYAVNGRWKDSANVRISAKTQGLKKAPGQSWIEVKKKVYMFLAGQPMESEMEDVHIMLNILSLHMAKEERMPQKSFALKCAEEQEDYLYLTS